MSKKRKRASRGRPDYQPTLEERQRVAIAAGGGMSHEEIAIGVGISRGTLEKHFAHELSHGAYARRLAPVSAMVSDFERALQAEEARARDELKRASIEVRQRVSELLESAREAAGAGDAMRALARGFMLGVLLTETRLVPLAQKGEAFTGKRRGLSRLYRIAVEVQSKNDDFSTEQILQVLKAADEVRGGEHALLWKDDQGRRRSTSRTEFIKQMSRHRARLRSLLPTKANAPISPGCESSPTVEVGTNETEVTT